MSARRRQKTDGLAFTGGEAPTVAPHWRRIGRELVHRAQSCRVPDYPLGIGGSRMAHSFPPSRSISRFSGFTSSRGAPRGAALRGALPLLFGLVCVLLVALAGCGGTSGSGGSNAPVSGGTLNVGLTSDVVTLDPLKSSALVDRQV